MFAKFKSIVLVYTWCIAAAGLSVSLSASLSGCNSAAPETPDNAAWKRAQQSNTIDRYRSYVEIHPQGVHVGQAKEAINRLEAEAKNKAAQALEDAERKAKAARDPVAEAFSQAWAEHKIESFEAFAKAYPNSEQAKSARNEIQVIMRKNKWAKIVNDGSIDAIVAFLAEYPDAAADAEQLWWSRLGTKAKAEDYEAFVKRFPKTQHLYQARIYVASNSPEYLAAQQDKTFASYEAFVKKYPDGVLADDARMQMAKIEWKSVAAGNPTAETIRAFLAKYPRNYGASEALLRLGDVEWGQATRTHTIEAYVAYLREFRTTPASERDKEADRQIQNLSWDRAAKIGTPESYGEYVRKYPFDEKVEESLRLPLLAARDKGQGDAFYAAFKDQPKLVDKLKSFEKDYDFAGKFGPARAGKPVPGTRPYGGKSDKGIVVVSEAGHLHPWHRKIRGHVDDLASAELVLILGFEQKSLVESKEYFGDKGRRTISRFQFGMSVKLVEASTGKLVAEQYVTNAPRELKLSELAYLEFIGTPIGEVQIQNWLANPPAKK